MKYEIKYRVVPYGQYWRLQYKSLFRWKNFTGNMWGGAPINYFDKSDAEMQMRIMQRDWQNMVAQWNWNELKTNLKLKLKSLWK